MGQLIERTVTDHPHHSLYIILALANAGRDAEVDGGLGARPKRSVRMARAQSTEEEVRGNHWSPKEVDMFH